MKLKHKFVINKIAGETVAVPICENGERFDGYIKLNKSGEIIFKALEKDAQMGDIFAALKANFPDGSDSEIKENINEFLAKLETADLLC